MTVRGHGPTAPLAAAALAASLYVALTATGLGDYPGDAGPAMHALLRGDLHAFATSRPAMGTLALLIRLPFAAVAHLGSPSEASIYRWGAFPCVASMGLLGVWLAGLARERGAGLVGQAAIVAVAIFNPFTQSALALGHPEELLTASLAVGSVVAASRQRSVLAAVLLGLAVATKQWAVIAALPVLVVLEAGRVRALAVAVTLAVVCTLPSVVGAPGAFLANNVALAHEQFLTPSGYSWFFPVAPRVTHHLAGGLVVRGARLPAGLVGLLHPLIILTSALLAAQLARLGSRGRTIDRIFAAVGLAFVLRCTLDTETMPYFYAPLFATLLAWDAMRGGNDLPVLALGGAAIGYALFDRLTPAAIGTGPATWLYTGVTLAAAGLLVTIMGDARGRDRRAAR
ncbi:MAG TPA: glycosyltransferase 87 family protein, partial [Solirubrobacteraceae bacterium]|nr:glycosyltransferase 87 family protein [Solirubrobacteraceae bacterium]